MSMRNMLEVVLAQPEPLLEILKVEEIVAVVSTLESLTSEELEVEADCRRVRPPKRLGGFGVL